MTLLAITIIGTFLGTILAVEAKAWMPYLAARLVKATIARFPDGLEDEMRVRWDEEIRADLASYGDRPLGGLIFALRLRLRGGRALASELALQQTLDAKGDDSKSPVPESSRTGVVVIETYQGTFEVQLDSNIGPAYLNHGTIISGPGGSVSIEDLGPELTSAIARAADVHRIRSRGDEQPRR